MHSIKKKDPQAWAKWTAAGAVATGNFRVDAQLGQTDRFRITRSLSPSELLESMNTCSYRAGSFAEFLKSVGSDNDTLH